ncbi:AtpF F0F1-type ATP synthase, subunit b [Fimbriimonadaceae bacterium]|jgi:F-type H+-transporting ATPase subunit b
MSNEQKSSGSPIVGIIIGAVLMVGGTYLSLNAKALGVGGIQETLEGQGIPLDFGKTIGTIGVFLILFPVIKSFFIKPLQDAIQERNSDLERTFTEAENLRTEMERMKSDYDRRLAESEANAREQIQSQIREAQNLRSSLMAEAATRADALVQQATAEIEAEKQKVLVELRTHVVDLALAAAEKVVGENMDSERNRRLVDDYINSVEVVA